ncbi:MAG: hypothetical protein ABIP38_14500 [Steroidobacteraceae bacterium]
MLGTMAATGAGLLDVSTARGAESAGSPARDVGASQRPPITDVKDKVAYITGGSSGNSPI